MNKSQYDSFATSYLHVEDLPCSLIEAQLIQTALALSPCEGLTVLDLGGGSGLHARRAVAAGAARVDVVDISREMMRAGEEIEASLGRGTERSNKPENEDENVKIRWIHADISKSIPLSANLDPKGYDIVMANWLFDHATSEADLLGMWTNVVTHLKSPGGRFLGVRVQNLQAAQYMVSGKYGALFKDIREIPGGFGYVCGCLTNPPFEFGCTSMRSTLELDHTIPRTLGLVDFAVIPPEEMQVVKENPEYWADFVKTPNLAVVVARKA